MTAGRPRSDADVPAYWQSLGLTGIVDLHVHFMPDNVLQKVWAYFDSAGPLTARHWPIRYRWPEADRLAHLRSMGVRRFGSLLYPHKPAMAAWLNEWGASFAAEHDDVVQTLTFFPEPSAPAYVETALRGGAQLAKVHVQVGGFDPRDPLLDPVWGMLADAALPVIVHAGSGPAPGSFTGPGPFGAVLARHARLTAVIAHMGMPEYDEFLSFAERYPNLHVDTTMCFVDFFDASAAAELRRALAPRLSALGEKVVFGADFPNIPYDYAHQIDVLARLELGDEWMRGVLWHNPVRLIDGVASNGQNS